MHSTLINYSTICTAILCCLAVASGQSTLAAAQTDDAPGSTMTLEQLQQEAKSPAEKALEDIRPVEAASEPSPALKYRLYPAKWDLQPGSAIAALQPSHHLVSATAK